MSHAGNSNITFPGVEAELVLAHAPGVVVSTGSACESGAIEPSRVLRSIGLESDTAFSTVRFCVGRFTTFDDVITAAEQIVAACHQITDVL